MHHSAASTAATSLSSLITTSSGLGLANKYTTAASTGISSIMANNSHAGLSTLSGGHSMSLAMKTEPSTVTWAPTPQEAKKHEKSSEIDRIMAKIEQARLSIANVCVLSKITKIYSENERHKKTNFDFVSIDRFGARCERRKVFNNFFCRRNQKKISVRQNLDVRMRNFSFLSFATEN